MNRRLVITAYRRPQYFHLVAQSWAAARGIDDWHPTVFLEPSPLQAAMTTIATDANLQVHLNPTRHGVLHNPWVALNTAFTDGADFAVLAEDDVLVSDDILEYFTWASVALRYRNTLAVCAASFATDLRPDQDHQVVRTTQFCPLVWGTWISRWGGLLRDSWDHDYSSGTPEAPQSGWDWNINLRVIPDGGWHVVQPWASRSTHIGLLGGEHTTAASFPGSIAATFVTHCDPGHFYLVDR